MVENLSASGVAYEKLEAISPSLVAPKPAPTPMTSEWVAIGAQSGSSRRPIHRRFLEPDFQGVSRIYICELRVLGASLRTT